MSTKTLLYVNTEWVRAVISKVPQHSLERTTPEAIEIRERRPAINRDNLPTIFLELWWSPTTLCECRQQHNTVLMRTRWRCQKLHWNWKLGPITTLLIKINLKQALHQVILLPRWGDVNVIKKCQSQMISTSQAIWVTCLHGTMYLFETGGVTWSQGVTCCYALTQPLFLGKTILFIGASHVLTVPVSGAVAAM